MGQHSRPDRARSSDGGLSSYGNEHQEADTTVKMQDKTIERCRRACSDGFWTLLGLEMQLLIHYV